MEFKTGRSKHKIIQRPKSAATYTNKYPTFVVAFSLKETYDDLVTAQQMICNRYSPQNRSPQDSINSLTPTNSVKIIDNETPQPSTLNIEQAEFIDTPQLSTIEINQHVLVENRVDNEHPIPVEETIKIEQPVAFEQKSIDSKIQEIIECEQLVSKEYLKNVFDDLTEELNKVLGYPLNEECATKPEQLQESNGIESELTYEIINNEVPLKQSSENCMTVKNKPVDRSAPEIHLDIIKSKRKPYETKSPKCKSRNHRNARVRNPHFKYKNIKNNLHSRIGMYCNKSDEDSFHYGQIQQTLCSKSIANIVSRSSFQYAPLRTVLAKENLLEKTEIIYNNNNKSYDSTNTSDISFPPSTDKGASAYNSDTTLIDTESFKIDALTNDVNSIIEIRENDIYKSEVVNVAVAVAYNTKKGNKIQPVLVQENANMELISDETLMPAIGPLSSKLSPRASEISEVSTVTLVNNYDSSLVELLSDNDTYNIAKTSSVFTKASDMDINPTSKHSSQASTNETTLLDTVINLGIYNKASPSTSSAGTYDIIDPDKVIVTGLNKSYPINPKLIKCNKDYIVSDSVLKKSNLRAENFGNTSLNLSNPIKALIKENETSQRKCAEEARHPTSFPEMWEQIISVLDLAVKRLEDTLSERIIKELKKSIISFEGNKSWKDSKDVEMMSEEIAVLHKEVAAGEVRNETEQNMQCDLVNNKTIDDLMLKISTEGPKVISLVTTQSFPKIKSNILKDYFKVLKPPQEPLVIEKKDKVTVAVSALSRESEFTKFQRLRGALYAPKNFLRENIVVLVSVPSFLFLMACLYGVILLVITP